MATEQEVLRTKVRVNKVKEILGKTHTYEYPMFNHLEVLLIEDILEEWLERHLREV